MFTLANFYKSKEWEKLLSVIKMERVDESGQIICAHCGKPIIDKYDCIGHHTLFLTDDNVNDYDVSLNPALIQLVHHRCHNKIHNKLGYTKREIYLIYGPPMAGKSRYVSSVSEPGDFIIDINEIWKCVSGGESKPPKLNSVVFGIRDLMMDMVKYRVGKWDNAYIIGGFPLISERERLCKTLGAREIYIETPREICIKRLDESDRDTEAYTGFIDDWFRKFSPGMPPLPS